MPAQTNSIVLEGNGNITIQDVDNSTVTIYTNNLEELIKELKLLNEAQLDSLLQIADKQKEQLSESFKTHLKGVAKEKNVVKGSISNVKSVRIGDEIHYHYYPEHTLPKELTLRIPKVHPSDIIGREQDLDGLHHLLGTEKRVVVVNGLGGIGKTTLAQAYVSQYYGEYSHIAWITQTAENIAVDFINEKGLAKNLSIETAGLESEQVFEEIIRKLKAIEDKPNLLVIDNAGQSLSRYRDMLPGQPHWHLLITSREEIAGFHLRPLGFLSEGQAMELFKKHYPLQKLSNQDIKELVETVDYHTLTIEILAKTARRVQRYDAATLKAAIEKDLKANVEVAHNREYGKIEKVGSYLSTVFTLSKLNEQEAWLLKQFACLPSDFHTYDLLHELLIDDESPYKDSFSETLLELVQKGWLLYNESTESYKMHRIIAEVARKQLSVTAADVQHLLAFVTQKLILDDTKGNPIDRFIWEPFGKAILANFREDVSSEIADLQNSLALVLQDLWEYQGAKELLEKAVKSDEQNFREDHPSTARSYSNLAMVLLNLGEYQEAKQLLEKAVKFYEQNFGQNHTDTARSYSNLALVLQHLGEYQGAKQLLEKAVKFYEQNFGQDYPLTAISYSNLAMVLRDLGEYQGAKELLEIAVKSDEQNFREDHPSTARSYSNLALVLLNLGEYQEAKQLLEKAVKSNEQNFREDHPSMAESYSKLALLLRHLGEYPKALELAGKALTIFKKTLPEGHSSIKTMDNVYQSIKNKIQS